MLTFVPSSSYNKYWQLSSPLSPHHVHQESPLRSTPTTAVSPLGTPLHLDSFKIPLSFLSDLWYRAQTTDHIQSHALIFYIQPHESDSLFTSTSIYKLKIKMIRVIPADLLVRTVAFTFVLLSCDSSCFSSSLSEHLQPVSFQQSRHAWNAEASLISYQVAIISKPTLRELTCRFDFAIAQ